MRFSVSQWALVRKISDLTAQKLSSRVGVGDDRETVSRPPLGLVG